MYFDLAWKYTQSYSRKEGLKLQLPICLMTAFQLNLIEYNESWLELLEDGNLSVHIYKDNYAKYVHILLKPHMLFLDQAQTSALASKRGFLKEIKLTGLRSLRLIFHLQKTFFIYSIRREAD
jgi:hypothetical protein